jgi:hypothetical protein
MNAAAPPPPSPSPLPPAKYFAKAEADASVAARLSVVFLPSPRRAGGSRESTGEPRESSPDEPSAAAKTSRD